MPPGRLACYSAYALLDAGRQQWPPFGGRSGRGGHALLAVNIAHRFGGLRPRGPWPIVMWQKEEAVQEEKGGTLRHYYATITPLLRRYVQPREFAATSYLLPSTS